MAPRPQNGFVSHFLANFDPIFPHFRAIPGALWPRFTTRFEPRIFWPKFGRFRRFWPGFGVIFGQNSLIGWIGERDTVGRSPLIMAASCNHVDAAEFLISRGARVNATSICNLTALLWGCWLGNFSADKLSVNSPINSPIKFPDSFPV
jgi:hypothetical protein